MKLIFSSQDFGYGPTSQMFSLLKHLLREGYRKEILIKSSKTTKIFFDNFCKENTQAKIRLIDNLEDEVGDLYVSLYDPHCIFEAKKQKKKSIFLCNLTFLRNESILEKDIKSLTQNWESFITKRNNNHHNLIILAYLLADHVYIRKTDQVNIHSLLYQAIKEKTSLIGPIIYPKIKSTSRKKCYHLIQLGGQINPLSGEKFYTIYFKLIKKLFNHYKEELIFMVNPHLKNLAQKELGIWTILTTVWQHEYHKLLSETKILYSPFWINTFLESAYYNIPTYILPEQHLGHIKSLLQYFNINTITQYWSTRYEQENYSLERKNESDFLSYLQKSYEQNLNNINRNIKAIPEKNIIKEYKYDKLINQDLDLVLKMILEHDKR